MPVAAALASTAVSAFASHEAAKSQEDSTKAGLKQTSKMAAQSRADAINLYNQGIKSGRKGLSAAFDFYKQAAPSKYSPITQSSVAAQSVIGQGATQANNAILGLPVDMSFTTPQQINPDLSYLQGAKLPEQDSGYLESMQAQQPAEQKSSGGSSGSKGKNFIKGEMLTGGITGGIAGLANSKGKSGIKKVLGGGIF